MHAILFSLAKWIVGGLIARMIIGAGMTVVSYIAFIPIVQFGLDQVSDAMGGMAGDMLNVLLLGGVGEVLSIVGSGLLTRVSMVAGLAGLARMADIQQQG